MLHQQIKMFFLHKKLFCCGLSAALSPCGSESHRNFWYRRKLIGRIYSFPSSEKYRNIYMYAPCPCKNAQLLYSKWCFCYQLIQAKSIFTYNVVKLLLSTVFCFYWNNLSQRFITFYCWIVSRDYMLQGSHIQILTGAGNNKVEWSSHGGEWRILPFPQRRLGGGEPYFSGITNYANYDMGRHKLIF